MKEVTIGNEEKEPQTLEEAIEVLRAKNEQIWKMKFDGFMKGRRGGARGSVFPSNEPIMVENSPRIRQQICNTEYGENYTIEQESAQSKITSLQEELSLQTLRGDQLKEAYFTAKKQISSQKRIIDEIEKSSKQALQEDNESWEKQTSSLKEASDKELQRLQLEVNKLHEVLADWINKYMELQEDRGLKPSLHTKLLIETLKHNKSPQTDEIVSQMTKVAFNGTASRKMGELSVLLDTKSGDCVNLTSQTGMNLGKSRSHNSPISYQEVLTVLPFSSMLCH